jgi:c-di-GMP-binding flagellar brake protein YcgR
MGTASRIEEQEDACILTSSGEIARIIKDMQRSQAFVTVGLMGGKKMSSMILDIDTSSREFVYEAGHEDDVRTVLASAKIYFYARLRGVSVRFAVTSAATTTFEETPALRSPFPVEMEYLQRRENFRTILVKPFAATLKLPNGQLVVLDLKDISAGGVGLTSMTIAADTLQPDGIFDANLDFAELGKMDVTLKISTYTKLEHNGRFTHRYGCAFQNLARDKETKVQQLVFKLDQLNRANNIVREK